MQIACLKAEFLVNLVLGARCSSGTDLKVLISANGLAMVLMTPWIGSLMALRQTAIKNTF